MTIVRQTVKNVVVYQGSFTDSSIKQSFINLMKQSEHTQMSTSYIGDSNNQNIFLNNIINRLINFRDAMNAPVQTKETQRVILEHYDYLVGSGNQNSENSEMRGLQCHLTSNIFYEGFYKNSKAFSGMQKLFSGKSLGESQELITPYNPEVIIPPSFSNLTGTSFNQGIEYNSLLLYSGQYNKKIIATDDQNLNDPTIQQHLEPNSPLIKNSPNDQIVEDAVLIHKDLPLDKNNKIITTTTDVKQQPLSKVLSNSTTPGIYNVGQITPKQQTDACNYLRSEIGKNISYKTGIVRHVNNLSGNDTSMEKKALQDLDTLKQFRAVKDLLNIPHIVTTESNRGRKIISKDEDQE